MISAYNFFHATAAGGGGGGFTDTFTGSAGNLSSHTADTGQTYTAYSQTGGGLLKIDGSGKAYHHSSAGTSASCALDSGTSGDITITVDVYTPHSGSYWQAGLRIKAPNSDPENNSIFLYVTYNGGVVFGKTESGSGTTWTTTAAGVVSNGATTTLKLVVSGTNVSAYYGATQVGSTQTIPASLRSNTYASIVSYYEGSANTFTWDNFQGVV